MSTLNYISMFYSFFFFFIQMLNTTVNYWIDTSKDMDLNNFEEIGFIGGGNSANTVQYKNKQTQEKYCVKIYKPEFIRTNGNRLNQEISLLSQIDYPTILSLYGYKMYSQIVQSPIIITKYYPKNLNSYLRKNEISLSKKYIIIFGIAEGMKFLHLVNITHRDLKPENILLDENDHPIIGDLGISRFGSQGMGTDIGTTAYLAPEVVSGNYSNKVDVYSFAITMLEIITQQPAYTIPTDNYNFIQRVVNGFRPLTIDNIKNTIIKEFIQNCWAAEPTQRPSFKDIVEKIKSPDFKEAMQVDENIVASYLATFDKLKDPNLVRQKADSGNIVQAVRYADMLRTGENFPVDEKEAFHYYRIAAAQNNTYAMQQCASLLIKEGKKNEATNYLKSAIRMGDGDALKYFIDEKLDELNRNEIADLFKSCASFDKWNIYCILFFLHFTIIKAYWDTINKINIHFLKSFFIHYL